MLITKQKPMEEIMEYLDGEESIFVVGCEGCAEGCETGGRQQVMEMEQRLGEAGKTVTGVALIDIMCNEQLTKMTLRAHESKIVDSDSVLVLSCGVGIQTTSSVVDKVVHPGCNTVPLTGRHAEWREADRSCLECGQCVLEFTGGICPIATCAKSLLNGPCGGSQNGKCEVSPDIPCGWQLIYDRLEALGLLDILEEIVPPKDWSAGWASAFVPISERISSP